MDPDIGQRFMAFLQERGVGITGTYGQQRWVTHLDVDDTAVEGALEEVAAFFRA
jgi:threonine aldolase